MSYGFGKLAYMRVVNSGWGGKSMIFVFDRFGDNLQDDIQERTS